MAASDVDSASLAYSAAGLPAGLAIDPASGLISGTIGFDAAAASPYAVTVGVTDGIVPAPVSGTFSWAVSDTNRAPVADAQSVTTAEDTAAPVTLAGSDPDGDPLTYAVVDAPAHGALSGDRPGPHLHPGRGLRGPDGFTFTVGDGSLTSAPATVSITVTGVNDAPVCYDGDRTTPEDTALASTVSCTDADPGDALAHAVVDAPAHGALDLAADGGFTYTPDADYAGPDGFTFSASDGAAGSNVATISITVTPVNDAPVLTAPADQSQRRGRRSSASRWRPATSTARASRTARPASPPASPSTRPAA